MRREYKDYLTDIVAAIQRIEEFTKGISFNRFEKDDKTAFATLRALEIIGEAVKKIPRNVKNKYKQVPWKEIAGMRDKLIHEYFGVNIEVVWKTIKEDIPTLKPLLRRLLEDLKKK